MLGESLDGCHPAFPLRLTGQPFAIFIGMGSHAGHRNTPDPRFLDDFVHDGTVMLEIVLIQFFSKDALKVFELIEIQQRQLGDLAIVDPLDEILDWITSTVLVAIIPYA